MKILTWRGRGGRQRLCCRVLASLLTSRTVNLQNKHVQDFTVYCPIPEFSLWRYDGFVVTSNFTVWLGFRHQHLLHHTSTTPEHSVKLLCMPPKPACHSCSFSLFCVFFPPPDACKPTHSLSPPLTCRLARSLIHWPLDTHACTHSSTPQGSNRRYVSVSLPSPRPHVPLQQISGQRCWKSGFWRRKRRTKVCECAVGFRCWVVPACQCVSIWADFWSGLTEGF